MLKGFAFSCVACCTAECITCPIDVVKTRLQLSGELGAKKMYGGVFDAVKQISRKEGVRALWKGLSPALIRQMTYGSARYGSYEPIKKRLGVDSSGNCPLWKKILAGAISGTCSSAFAVPSDVLKVRMMADNTSDPNKRPKMAKIIRDIIKPTIRTMIDLGYPFKGFLYAGVMFTKKGIYLIEYNVRLGDPECQAVLGRLRTDFIDICLAIKNKTLSNLKVEKLKKKVACIVLASKGYPEKYSKNIEIFGINSSKGNNNIKIYHAGTIRDNSGKILTNGGRVLNIIGKADTMKSALELAYGACKKIYWKGCLYRRDIGS